MCIFVAYVSGEFRGRVLPLSLLKAAMTQNIR
jgi:hypothetical protein